MKAKFTISCVTLTLFVIFAEMASADIRPVPGDCSMYQHCDQSGCFTKPCGVGTEFNPNIMTCDYPLRDRTDCLNRGK